jgi:tetratricopeptide (TPR) repeat protein
MPTTYNGIGTRYYGKKNQETRPGVCEHCSRAATLASYDTRLWFVVLLIPVIPLERKRILDYCPHCTRHRVFSLKEWEKLKAEQLAKALEKVKAAPDDTEAAFRLHGALVAFGQSAEAEKLSARMQERFARDARTQAYLGSVKEYQGRPAEALPFYQRALALNPELPEAKVAVGLDLVRQEKLEEAHQLLRFLEAQEAPQNPGALFALGCGYQKANRHREALALFTLLASRFPRLSQDKAFRATVKKSETATGAASSTLPPRRVNLKPALGWAVAVVVALIAAFGSNYYVSRNRTLHLVSGLDQTVTVEVAGHGSVTLNQPGRRELRLPEGAYRATVLGAVTQAVDFVISSGFFDRWFKQPVWVLNAGGSALLLVENTVYSASPTERGGSYQFHFGKPFLFVPQVDYPFAPFPEQIRVDSHSKQVGKSRIDLFLPGPAPAFYGLAADGRTAEALQLAEWALRRNPEDTTLLLPYLGVAQASQREAQARTLLTEAVQRRPIEIQWHRAYQEQRSNGKELPALLEEYDALLKADPENSALLYLRGRLCTSKREAIPLYERAIERNPTNAFAHFALGMSYASTADWSRARGPLNRAVELMPDEDQFQEGRFEACLALGDFSTLEKELRAELQKEPTHYAAALHLGQVLLAQNQREAADAVVADYARQARAALQQAAEEVVASLHTRLAYAAGDLETVLTNATKLNAEVAQFYRVRVLAESGRAKEAAQLLDAAKEGLPDPFEVLAFSLACARAGETALAETWRTKALRELAEGRADSAAAAQMLERAQPAPLAEALDLSLAARHKAILLVALAERSPTESAALRAAARQLNVTREFPYHLVNQLTGTAATPTTKPAD